MAQEGKLSQSQAFTKLCQVFEDWLCQESSDNKNMKYGTRYLKHYLNFMILMCSWGGSTAQQYGILTSELGGLTPRHLRYGTLLSNTFWDNLLMSVQITCRQLRGCPAGSSTCLREHGVGATPCQSCEFPWCNNYLI